MNSPSEYLMLNWLITSHHPLDMLGMSIRYCLANLYNTYTMYNLLGVCWHILNNTMSQYYVHHYWIFGPNDLQQSFLKQDPEFKLGGVGHCCAWHVRVPRGFIGFYVKWHKEISVSTGMSALGSS
jgi:hypothetical protein